MTYNLLLAFLLLTIVYYSMSVTDHHSGIKLDVNLK